MATFNLIPNPTVLAVNTGVFLTSIVVVKKLMVDPYLKLRDKREAATSGNQEQSKTLLEECERLTASIDAKLKEAANEARAIREDVRQQAINKRKSVVGAAEEESKKALNEVQNRVVSEYEEEKKKIPNTVNELTSRFMQLVMH